MADSTPGRSTGPSTTITDSRCFAEFVRAPFSTLWCANIVALDGPYPRGPSST